MAMETPNLWCEISTKAGPSIEGEDGNIRGSEGGWEHGEHSESCRQVIGKHGQIYLHIIYIYSCIIITYNYTYIYI